MRFNLIFLIVGITIALIVSYPGCKQSESFGPQNLTGHKWILVSIEYPLKNVGSFSNTFNIVFNSDGTFNMQVDCNFCGGEYQVEGNDFILLATNVCTEAYCGPDSLDTEFHNALNNATRFEVRGDNLRIYFGDSSYLNFNAE